MASESSPHSSDCETPGGPQATSQSGHASTASFSVPTPLYDTPKIEYTALGTDVMYSYYSFLSADAIHQLLLEDLQYLEKLGCYRVPSRASVDEFVKAYFRYVHPHQPILDEGEFWQAYTKTSSARTRTISIFVFQAMLFAACSFVPLSTIARLGFTNFRTARAIFYRRAQALFHVDSCRDTLSSAQGALLLTNYVSASDAEANTRWLSSAICLARSINAHRHHSLKEASTQRRDALGRLWCCCLLRDRILALGLRRPMQIGSGKGVLAGIEAKILCAETNQSMVYDSTTKLALMTSFSALCDLAYLSSEALEILSLEPFCAGSGELTTITDRVRVCADNLDQWFVKAVASRRNNSGADKFVALQNNVIFIYYHSAKIALWNHAIYIAIAKGCPLHMEISAGWREVETAIHGIDISLQQIADHDMLSFMPISIIAHIAIPLVRHIVHIKLDRRGQSVTVRRCLKVYLVALNALKEQYEGVSQVLYYIRRIVTCLDAHKSPRPSCPDVPSLDNCPPHNSDEAEGFIYSPQFFLRTMVLVQLALSQGKYPEEHEIPVPLVYPPAGSSDQITCTCVSNEGLELPDLGDAFNALLDPAFDTGGLVLNQTEDPYMNGAALTGRPDSPTSTVDLNEFPDLFNDA